MPSIATDVTAATRDPSVCVSVTLMNPAKGIGWNEMSFGKDTHVTVPGPHEEGDFWIYGSEVRTLPSSPRIAKTSRPISPR